MELNRVHTYPFYTLWNSLEHQNDMACKATCIQHVWKVPQEGLLPRWQHKTDTLRHNGQDSIWNLHYCRADLLLRQRGRLLKLGQAMHMQPFGEEQDKIYWVIIYTYLYVIHYDMYIYIYIDKVFHVVCRQIWCTIYIEIPKWQMCLFKLNFEYDGCSINYASLELWLRRISRCIPPAIILHRLPTISCTSSINKDT